MLTIIIHNVDYDSGGVQINSRVIGILQNNYEPLHRFVSQVVNDDHLYTVLSGTCVKFQSQVKRLVILGALWMIKTAEHTIYLVVTSHKRPMLIQ